MNKLKLKLKNHLYYMHMKNVETLDTTMGHQQASWQKRNLKVDLGKCVQMYRAHSYICLGPPIH